MATVCINGETLVELNKESIRKMPDPFGVGDFEEILVKAAARQGSRVVSVKEMFINGVNLDKKKIKGFVWADLNIKQDSVIGVFAEMEPQEDRASEETNKSKMSGENQPKGGKKKAGGTMDEEKQKPKSKEFAFDMAYFKKHQVDKRVLENATDTASIRDKIINYIRGYNQIRDLEDKNMENKTSLKYADRGDMFQKIVERLQKDDLGGYMYQDVKGYDLEELIHIATELENKQMENEDWTQLYKYLVDYFGD